jgi:hypothetical protein
MMLGHRPSIHNVCLLDDHCARNRRCPMPVSCQTVRISCTKSTPRACTSRMGAVFTAGWADSGADPSRTARSPGKKQAPMNEIDSSGRWQSNGFPAYSNRPKKHDAPPKSRAHPRMGGRGFCRRPANRRDDGGRKTENPARHLPGPSASSRLQAPRPVPVPARPTPVRRPGPAGDGRRPGFMPG